MAKTTIHIGRPCGLKDTAQQTSLSGLRNGEKLNLKANTERLYKLPKQAYLVAVIALTPGALRLGENGSLGSFELQAGNVAEVGYCQGPAVALVATTDMEVQTIIYKY